MRIKGHRIKLQKEHVQRMRIPVRFWSVTFTQVAPESQAKLRRVFETLDTMLDHGEGLLMWGENGVGKTSIAVLVAFECRRRGASVMFLTAEELREAFINPVAFDYEQTINERASMVDVLVIDDLGKEHRGDSGFAERVFENLFRRRAAAKKMTIVTTNIAAGKPEGDDRQATGLHAVYSKSLLDVFKESLYPLCIEGENKRNAIRDEIKGRLAV